MNTIPIINLALAFIPIIIVLAIMLLWQLNIQRESIALARMLGQLALIGYALNWIFNVNSPVMVSVILAFMLIAASSIALGPLSKKTYRHYVFALTAITLGGISTLTFIVSIVLNIKPWYSASAIIPLAGMVFAAAMNAVSLTAERFFMQMQHGDDIKQAKVLAFKAGLIPLFNALLAVGIVSLPGMMTGQILSGVDPLIAARYQIVVMCMLTGSGGISAAIYLELCCRFELNKLRPGH